jgi:hypothetical protein
MTIPEGSEQPCAAGASGIATGSPREPVRAGGRADRESRYRCTPAPCEDDVVAAKAKWRCGPALR